MLFPLSKERKKEKKKRREKKQQRSISNTRKRWPWGEKKRSVLSLRRKEGGQEIPRAGDKKKKSRSKGKTPRVARDDPVVPFGSPKKEKKKEKRGRWGGGGLAKPHKRGGKTRRARVCMVPPGGGSK